MTNEYAAHIKIKLHNGYVMMPLSAVIIRKTRNESSDIINHSVLFGHHYHHISEVQFKAIEKVLMRVSPWDPLGLEEKKDDDGDQERVRTIRVNDPIRKVFD